MSAVVVFGTATLAVASVSTDSYYYSAGDTAQINGDQMSPGENVTVDVNYPDGTLAQEHVVVADANGDFADSYTLPTAAPGGVYTVVATGQTSGDVYTTTFDPGTVTITSGTPGHITYGSSETTTGSTGLELIRFDGQVGCVDYAA